jgi:hypothetical protein
MKGHPLRHKPYKFNERTRLTLARLSRAGSEGATPADLGISATLLEQLIFRRLAERIAPLAPGASYRYRISEKGATSLIPGGEGGL